MSGLLPRWMFSVLKRAPGVDPVVELRDEIENSRRRLALVVVVYLVAVKKWIANLGVKPCREFVEFRVCDAEAVRRLNECR